MAATNRDMSEREKFLLRIGPVAYEAAQSSDRTVVAAGRILEAIAKAMQMGEKTTFALLQHIHTFKPPV